MWSKNPQPLLTAFLVSEVRYVCGLARRELNGTGAEPGRSLGQRRTVLLPAETGAAEAANQHEQIVKPLELT